MPPDLFGIDLAGEIYGALGDGLLPVTIVRRTEGVRVVGTLTAGQTLASATHTGVGWLEDYRDREIDGEVIKVGDRKIGILGASIAPALVPDDGDLVTIEGTQYRVHHVTRDPAAAAYVCQARK